MTYGELKNFVLQLLNRYSIAGEKVDASYNDQADILARIPALVRDGLYYMATSCRRLRTLAPLFNAKDIGQWHLYQLPDDCYQLIGGLVQLHDNGDISRFSGFRSAGGRQVLVPKGYDGHFLVEYYRYPVSLDTTPHDGDFLDCPPEARSALAYYVASHLAMEDNNYMHSALYNEFEMRMLRLQEGITAERGTVEDVYV